MEIGSFIELDFRKGLEYYNGNNVVRLNCGRAGIYHSLKVLSCKTIYLPYYQCDSVRDFLLKKEINIKYYHLDNNFNPKNLEVEDNAAVLFVNYFGVMSNKRMALLASNYKNVIIDNSQAFFAEPINNCINVYSPRKFVGVPDGCYVIGDNISEYKDHYKQDFSSDTSLFLLQRIEYGCEKSYSSRMINEKRIDNSDILKMSKLTQILLDNVNYEYIKTKRKENFKHAIELFGSINKINPERYIDNNCVPMVYPLVVEDERLLSHLIDNKIFQGRWWSYILNELSENTFETYLSNFIIPITIDQRYDISALLYTKNIIDNYLEKISNNK